MSEGEWLDCNDALRMLDFLQARVGERKRRLLAVACCRRVWHRLPDPRSQQAVIVAERFLDGNASEDELRAAQEQAEAANEDAHVHRRLSAGEQAASDLAQMPAWTPDGNWPCLASVLMRAREAGAEAVELSGKNRKERRTKWHRGWFEGDKAQATLLRDLVGNPFRPAAFDPAWVSPTVWAIAQAAYEVRDLPAGSLEPARLAVLADALEEAGCMDVGVLAHLRGTGLHVRGCWLVDLVLEKV